MAYILGIFEEFNYNAGNLFSNRKKFLERAIYLTLISFGGFTSLAIVARLFTILLQTNLSKQLTYMAFIGMIIGSIPQLWRNYDNLKINFKRSLIFILAFAGVIALAIFAKYAVKPDDAALLYNTEHFFRSVHISFLFGLWLFIGGLLASASTIMPGFSGSALLISLGIYYDMLFYMDNRVLLPIILISVGTTCGTLIFSKIVNFFLREYPRETVYFLLGLLIASIYQLFLQIYSIIDYSFVTSLYSVISLFCGILIAYFLGRFKKNK